MAKLQHVKPCMFWDTVLSYWLVGLLRHTKQVTVTLCCFIETVSRCHKLFYFKQTCRTCITCIVDTVISGLFRLLSVQQYIVAVV